MVNLYSSNIWLENFFARECDFFIQSTCHVCVEFFHLVDKSTWNGLGQTFCQNSRVKPVQWDLKQCDLDKKKNDCKKFVFVANFWKMTFIMILENDEPTIIENRNA